MPQPKLLDSEVDAYLRLRRAIRGMDENRSTKVIGVDEKHVIVWGWSRGWSAQRIATAIGRRSRDPVHLYRSKVLNSPAIVFQELTLYTPIDKNKFQCRICGEYRTTRTKTMRHVLDHFLPREIAKAANLNSVEKPL